MAKNDCAGTKDGTMRVRAKQVRRPPLCDKICYNSKQSDQPSVQRYDDNKMGLCVIAPCIGKQCWLGFHNIPPVN